MSKLRTINFKKIRLFFGKLPKILGENAFWTFLGLFIIALLIGGIIFYRYNILPKKVEVPSPEGILKFQEEDYQQVLQVWQAKELNFQEADLKEYPNPFK
jgi:hypothetical protein